MYYNVINLTTGRGLDIYINKKMIVNKKRIRNIDGYIHHINGGSSLIIGVASCGRFPEKLKKIGLIEPYQDGQLILAPGTFGPISKYNAEGKEIIHKDKPMERVYRQGEWHWNEWHGPYTVEQSKIVDIPYSRYPRTFSPPPAIEFMISADKDGGYNLVSPVIIKTEENKELITHVVNLFLEIFGECEFFTDNLERIIKTPLIRLNWDVLPKGEMPWLQYKKHLEPFIKKAPKGNQPVIEHRFETINKQSPDFRAIGRGGFHGYVVHGFSKKGLFVLESMYYGNATYVFENDWEKLSKLTKAEILNEKLQKDRLIHLEGWERKVRTLLGSKNG
jgi:hypothetical protein